MDVTCGLMLVLQRFHYFQVWFVQDLFQEYLLFFKINVIVWCIGADGYVLDNVGL